MDGQAPKTGSDDEAMAAEEEDTLSEPSCQRFRSPENVLEYWEHQFGKDSLTSHDFREWWRVQVPKTFSPIPSMDYLYPLAHVEDSAVEEMLMAPLEKFLCGDSKPNEVFKNLAEKNDPPTTCGKRFKFGEPTYSCRDCGNDPSCVLCANCFKNSGHQSHRYKISTTNGSGYCDCGDPEAWSDNVSCAIHEQGEATGQMDTNDLINRLPENIRNRARIVFSSVLDYVFEILTTEILLKLPPDLTYKVPSEVEEFSLESNDDYVTVIYNDEYHRFEEVIDTLRNVIECERTPAIGLTSLIDRNGRCIVKCSGFQICQEVKKNAERRSSRRAGRPLKIVIMHSHVVGHQNFAEKLVSWLQTVMEYSTSFRALLGALLLEFPGAPISSSKINRLDNFLRNDIILWKTARSSIHHFLVQAMLLGNDANRRAFATFFTKNYGQMMKEFIDDDHDHAFSVTSLSVQVFTAPTLAHYLIANHDVLHGLIRIFMSECERNKNERGKLELKRNLNQGMKRAYHILFDIKYLLTTTPADEKAKTGWTDALRKGFLHGISDLLEIFSWMQCMDLQIRQISQHIDQEFEWQPYFDLYVQFMSLVNLVTKWCSTDRVVYIKTLRMLFKKLFDEQKSTGEEFITHTVGGRQATCIDYQVSVRGWALHQPLTRLLSCLSLYMDKFELSFEANELDIMERPTAVQMMEPSLRTTVFVAQVQSGMWRRNGHSLWDQVRLYHDTRFRTEIEDRDIIMLQLGAANMHPDDFLINIISKYQLIQWTSEDFDCKEDDSIRQINVLAEEFLSTLIYILAERYIPRVGDVTHEDCVRNELIQLLCIGPTAHSTLNKFFADEVKQEANLERVLESVATFKKSTGSSSGKFKLKAEFFDRYNVFFYRYSREHQSKSEEAQRHRRKAANQPECTPPPLPPKFANQFKGILKIMECDVFLHSMALILERADNLRSRCFSENQVHKSLHLIGLCLLEEERDEAVAFTKSAAKYEILEKLQKLVGSQRIESHRDLLSWVISTWQRVARIKDPSVEAIMDIEEEAAKAVVEDKEEERKRLAAERRKKVMDQMKNAQRNFFKENKKMFEDTVQKRPRLATDSSNVDDSLDEQQQQQSQAVILQCLGPDRASATFVDETFHTCILCQEEEELTAEGSTLVTAAFLQKSTVLSNRRMTSMDGLNGRASDVIEPSLPILSSDLHSGIHSSSCGHVMHAKCWQGYFNDIQNSERNRSRITSRPLTFNAMKMEFLCPMCRNLSNTVIPLIPQLHTLQSNVFANQGNGNQDDLQVLEDEEATIGDAMSALTLSKGNEVDVSQPIRISFKDWMAALFTAQKYKKELAREKSRTVSGDNTGDDTPTSKSLPAQLGGIEVEIQRMIQTATDRASRVARVLSTSSSSSGGPRDRPRTLPRSTMKRYYTCPLDQVVQEMDQVNSDKSISLAFARLFNDQEGQELVFSESLHEVLQMFCNSVLRVARDVDEMPEEEEKIIDERALFEVFNTCAFTITSAVHAELDNGRASLVNPSGMSSRNRDCLSALVRFCGVMSSNFSEPKVIRSHGLRLLSLLTEIDGLENPSILDVDAFTLLVALTFCIPSLFNGDHAAHFPFGNVQDQHLLRLVYLFHLVQIMITTDQFSSSLEENKTEKTDDEEDYAIVLHSLHEVREAVGFASDDDGFEGLSAKGVWRDLQNTSLPFLRCAAVFYHHLTGVQGPSSLEHFADNEHEELSQFLGLPCKPKELFAEITERGLAGLWASHPAVQANLSVAASQVRSLSFPLKLNTLVQLPHDYTELMNNVATISCPNSSTNDSFRVPAMCLICGEVMCSQSYCCQTTVEGRKEPLGACTAHIRVCGGGVGIFLRIRECRVILLAEPSKGCFVQSPYVDQYGETDDLMKRGNPLHLCPSEYRKIYKLWLNHGIPQKISQSAEGNQFNGIHTPWSTL